MNRREAIHVAKLIDMKFLFPACKLVRQGKDGSLGSMPHLRWMIERIIADEMPDDMQMRWLGHIECALNLMWDVRLEEILAIHERNDLPADVVRLEDFRQ